MPAHEPLTSDSVRSYRFSVTKLTAGYDQEEVDDFLDLVVAALRAREAGQQSPLSAQDVLQQSFSQTKFREGYAMREVDDLLDRVAHTLGDAGSATGPAQQAAAAPPTVHDQAGTGHPDPDVTPGLIQPARGWRRLFGR